MTAMSNLNQAALWVSAEAKTDYVNTDSEFQRVCTDTRTLQAGDLFVALKGENYDAHDFLPTLQQGQVAAVMAERLPEPFHLPSLLVSNTRQALQKLSQGWRAQFTLPLAVVTGSNGKTTVKEMLASILNAAFGEDYVATRGNLNNDIGLPMTLLNLRAQHQGAVIELGMNHPGETAQLAPLAAPTVVIINNAQREHQEFMHTVEAVAHEHADALNALTAGGTAVFPADDAHAAVWYERAASVGAQVFDFSLNEASQAAFTARYELGLHASTVQIIGPLGQCTAQLNIPGEHNVHNALAAAAAACAMGIGLDVVAKGLAQFMPAKGRLQTHRLAQGLTLIDDTYNANPDSVRAAIDVLAASSGRKILVLGDMGEVGTQGEAYHREIGEYAASKGFALFVGAGELMRHAVDGFGQGATHTNDVPAIVALVREQLHDGAHTILVKGSRFMAMERVVDGLLQA
ncbi:MAG: UDP-N-acetylmuramoyl-tripeptide--D-alanyl-D-alanine ligase [Formosimonas sp.]